MLFTRGKRKTILFADVSGSSALYKSLGNEKAKSIIDQMIGVMTYNTEKYQGRVIKTIGDEIMACFDDCEKACRAAIAIQREIEGLSHGYTLGVRIGIGFGKTLEEGHDLFGEAVNDAAFVTGIAKSSQILLTESVAQQLPEPLRQSVQEFDQVTIKGSLHDSTIYRLFWKTPTSGFSETQVFSVQTVNEHLDTNQLLLTVGNRQFSISPETTPFVIGRNQQQVNLLIDNELVSRDHCHIVFRRGKFVLIDHSTNGTYIKPEDAQEIYLRREELPLLGNGTISLGISNHSPEATLIRFEI
jgi:class 3 adenylate cyclase